MNVVVVGAGIIGMTTAYYLARAGHRVTVLDAGTASGQETSAANGGQLSYSYVAPLAGPGVLPHVPGWLLNPDSPLRFTPRLDPSQWRWCAAFLQACNASASRHATQSLLTLAFYSRELVHEMVAREGIEFDFAERGKLLVYRDRGDFESARRQVDYQATLGCEQQLLDREATVACEPALADSSASIVGGIFTPSEDVGDCQALCTGLEAVLRREAGSVQFEFGVQVLKVLTAGSAVVGLHTSAGTFTADAYVIANGVGSPLLTRPLGVDPLVYGLKGYSLTYALAPDSVAPVISVTDTQRKVVYARLGERLRVAGMVDIGERGADIRPKRVQALAREAERMLPRLRARGEPKPWAGLRPARPDSIPWVGPTRYTGLWLNVGHGALGFTLAHGSGKLLADLIGGHEDKRAALFARAA